MKKLLIVAAAFVILMASSVYANVRADKPILVSTQDCSEATEILQMLIDDGKIDPSLTRNGFTDTTVIGNPFAVEYNDLGPKCFYVFPIINDSNITGYVSLSSPLDPNQPRFTVSGSGFFTGNDESWQQLTDGDEYIICETDNGWVYGVADDKKILLSYRYDDESDLTKLVPISAERTVVDITKPAHLNLRSVALMSDEEQKMWNDAKENGRVFMTINAEELGAVNRSGRLLVPIREISEIMNCNIEWKAENKTVEVTKDDNKVDFTIGQPCYSLNGEVHSIDVPAEIIDGKTYIPIRAVNEALGGNIYYNISSKVISMSFA